MKIGYMRPYQEDADCKEQTRLLQAVPCDFYMIEEHASAKRRTALDSALLQLQEGDTLVVAKLFVLADSTRHLIEVLDDLDQKGAYLFSIGEEIDTQIAAGRQFRANAHSLLNLQQDIVRENTIRGMYEAKQRGAKVGRPRKLDDNVKKAIQMYESKQYSLAQIKEQTGISKTTLYRYLEN
ncbi:recombinase family protein [Saccharibacillus kuerlensis]|uniref:Resolvase n=1 Tax=Saccharibacillus kuerlensis TaxID=459527 RepID=A0ABQ2L8E9_9BACL|nr:recombinase family protein [Saccharibacillus kuerlensis]GGO06611.1 resolvase [Saccharibacillus kuerlensis]